MNSELTNLYFQVFIEDLRFQLDPSRYIEKQNYIQL